MPENIDAGAADKLSQLLGRWTCVDEWSTWVIIEIGIIDNSIKLNVTDANDSESAEIYNVKFNDGTLEFAAYWSNGYFTKYKIRPLGHHIEVIGAYTHVDHFRRIENATVSCASEPDPNRVQNKSDAQKT